MADAKKCDICGKYYDKPCVDISILDTRKDMVCKKDICSECSDLIESFIESLAEGTLSVGLLDYLISVYGEDKLKSMLEQRGDNY